MMIDWFNAHEAVQVGAGLADELLSKTRRTAGGAGIPIQLGSADAERALRRGAGEIRPLKLNVFKRARLLNAFRWRLVEHGFEQAIAEALTNSLMMQITSADLTAAVPTSAAPSSDGGRSRRLTDLIAQADARFAEGDYQQAASRLQDAVEVDPRDATAHAKLGAAFFSLGQYSEAERELRRALELQATSPGANSNLGTLLRLKGQFAASETALRRAVKQDPRDPDALVSLGLTLGTRGQLGEAASCCEKALRLRPRHPGALCGLAWVAGIEGRFEEARALYERALEVDPRMPVALAALAEMRRMTPEDKEWLQRAEQALGATMLSANEARLRFAMGKYFDDLQNFSRAFEQYRRANDLSKPAVAPYDRAARTELVDDMIRVYSRASSLRQVEGACDSAKPVFVTGMPRSGTSLVDQILASHPRVAGAGELNFWNDAIHKHGHVLRREPCGAPLARKLTEGYLETLASHSRDALRVVDKATFNADCLGLIHSLFPRARIIYLRRDPIDTCLSCYFQNFANAASFAADLSDLAHYYREHDRLMRHWRAVLPGEALLEVPYAELVVDQEAWSRRIVEFIGLEWDARCMEFHRTDRPVLTASNWQVRQPIYVRSVGRWRNYEKFIRPLLELRELGSK